MRASSDEDKLSTDLSYNIFRAHLSLNYSSILIPGSDAVVGKQQHGGFSYASHARLLISLSLSV